MGCCRRQAQPQVALVVSELQALPAHKGGLGTHFLQPRQLSPCVCSKSGHLSNCVAVGTSMASGLHLAVSGSHPVPSSPNRKTLLLPPSVIGWGSILLRPTMQVSPGSSCLKHFPYGLRPIPLVSAFCHSMLTWPFRYSFAQKMTISHIHPIPGAPLQQLVLHLKYR